MDAYGTGANNLAPKASCMFAMGAEPNPDEVVEELMSSDLQIQHAAVIDEGYKILASKQRENIDPIVPLKILEKFNAVFPVVMTDSAFPLVEYCGTMRAITVHYEKLLILIYKARNRTILLTLNPKEDLPVTEKIATHLNKILS